MNGPYKADVILNINSVMDKLKENKYINVKKYSFRFDKNNANLLIGGEQNLTAGMLVANYFITA
jgi:hypothetical protein